MARKIPFDDPVTLNYVRIAYVAVQVIILGTYYYISMKVLRRLRTCREIPSKFNPSDQAEE